MNLRELVRYNGPHFLVILDLEAYGEGTSERWMYV